MKKYQLIYLFLVTFFSVYSLTAQYTNEPDHFFCGFDTEEEFQKWIIIDKNGPSSSNNYYWWTEDENGSAFFSPGTDQNGDDWLITPAITLTAGKQYLIKVKMWCDWKKKLTFAMGKVPTDEELSSNIIVPQADYDGRYYLSIEVPPITESGTYHFGILNETRAWNGPFYLSSFEVLEDTGSGILDVKTLALEDQTIIQDATVTLQGKFYEPSSAQTDAAGVARFENLTPGDYFLRLEATNRKTIADLPVQVVANQTVEVEQALEKLIQCRVSGRILDESGNPVEGAIIKLQGDNSFETTSSYLGEFVVENVLGNKNYSVEINKPLHQRYQATIDLGEADHSLGDITLPPLDLSPVLVQADQVTPGVLVSWLLPFRERDFVLDNNTYPGSYTFNANGFVVAGNILKGSIGIKEVSWVSDGSGNGNAVDVLIYALDNSGNPTEELLYHAKDVPNENSTNGEMVWNHHVLPESILSLNGCVVAIGRPNSISVGSDYETSGNSVAYDPALGWRVTEGVGTFLIRAVGLDCLGFGSAETLQNRLLSNPIIPTVQAAFATKNLQTVLQTHGMHFSVHRLLQTDIQDETKWQLIADQIQDLSILDSKLSEQAPGAYLYAITSIPTSGKASNPAFSNVVNHNTTTSVTIIVETNSAINLSDGALVEMVLDADPTVKFEKTVHQAMVSFDQIPKGQYTIQIKHNGFELYQSQRNFGEEKQYALVVELLLQPKGVYNLGYTQTEEGTDVLLHWNRYFGISDDIEGMEDFTINPSGTVGWEYIDGDGDQTYGVKQLEKNPFPHMYDPKAFIVINPSATNPSILSYVQPHSGKKVLASVALATGKENDDYLFSPVLNFPDEFSFSFYASAGFCGVFGDEEFMVGYSLSDQVSTEDIIWLTPTPEKVGGVWQFYSYTLPQTAKRVVVRCVSNQKMFFLLDDIAIGTIEPKIFAMTSFDVYVNGVFYANTTERELLIKGLSKGQNLVEVQVVYPMKSETKAYSEKQELVIDVKDYTGVEPIVSQLPYSYDPATRQIQAGETVQLLSIYDAKGALIAKIAQGQSMKLAQGIYIIQATTSENRNFTNKLLVK